MFIELSHPFSPHHHTPATKPAAAVATTRQVSLNLDSCLYARMRAAGPLVVASRERMRGWVVEARSTAARRNADAAKPLAGIASMACRTVGTSAAAPMRPAGVRAQANKRGVPMEGVVVPRWVPALQKATGLP